MSRQQPVIPLPERNPAALRAAVAQLDPSALARFEADWTAATARARDEMPPRSRAHKSQTRHSQGTHRYVLGNQPGLNAQLNALPWETTPVTAATSEISRATAVA